MQMNLCCNFHRQLMNVMPLQMNLRQDPKLASTTVLVALMEYFCGLKNHEKECSTVGMIVENFTVEIKGKYGLNMQAICDVQWLISSNMQAVCDAQ